MMDDGKKYVLRQVFGLLLGLTLTACHQPAQQQTQTTPTQPPAQVQTQSQTSDQNTNQTTGQTDSQSGLNWMSVSQLPPEGQQVYAQIGRGGPFAYSKDGSTFSNREGVLPQQARGYYREYTVPTPGASNRATRRIICGGQPVTSRADCYYTADHYSTFRRIRP